MIDWRYQQALNKRTQPQSTKEYQMAMAEENAYRGETRKSSRQEMDFSGALAMLQGRVTMLGENLAKVTDYAGTKLEPIMREDNPLPESGEMSEVVTTTRLGAQLVEMAQTLDGYDHYINRMISMLDRVDL